jgi:hypothetical protein
MSAMLSAEDKAQFDFNIGDMDWEPYFHIMTLGVRRCLNKEEPKTLAAARKKQNILAGLHYTLMLILYGMAYFSTYKMTGGDRTLALVSVPLTYLFFSII